jgi:hypothetical protein
VAHWRFHAGLYPTLDGLWLASYLGKVPKRIDLSKWL